MEYVLAHTYNSPLSITTNVFLLNTDNNGSVLHGKIQEIYEIYLKVGGHFRNRVVGWLFIFTNNS